MNRDIKFRGKRADNGDWVIGSLVMVCDGESLRRYPCIVISFNHDVFDWHEVIPETVGQFTGLTDKNGKEIFEGDIVRCKMPYGENFIVTWDEKRCAFYLKGLTKQDFAAYDKGYKMNAGKKEVYANIYDNPELK